MTVFSAVDAAFEGFRITWEKPRTLLVWTGFFVILNLLMPLIIFGLGLNTQLAALEAAADSPARDPAAELESMAALAPL